MGYHTHFYASIPEKQVDWAKKILRKCKKDLKERLNNTPNDDYFKSIYQMNLNETTQEKYEKFHEGIKEYNWPKWYIDEQEEYFAKYRDKDLTWEECEKKEFLENSEKLKETGLLDLTFNGDFGMDYVAFLIAYWEMFDRYLEIDSDEFVLHDNKIYSGNVFKKYYCVKGRYCQSMWFNYEGIIKMIEDYVDPKSYNPETHEYTKNLVLSDKEKLEIENFFRDYSDSYCWII